MFWLMKNVQSSQLSRFLGFLKVSKGSTSPLYKSLTSTPVSHPRVWRVYEYLIRFGPSQWPRPVCRPTAFPCPRKRATRNGRIGPARSADKGRCRCTRTAACSPGAPCAGRFRESEAGRPLWSPSHCRRTVPIWPVPWKRVGGQRLYNGQSAKIVSGHGRFKTTMNTKKVEIPRSAVLFSRLLPRNESAPTPCSPEIVQQPPSPSAHHLFPGIPIRVVSRTSHFSSGTPSDLT